jgi:hypothetical protein
MPHDAPPVATGSGLNLLSSLRKLFCGEVYETEPEVMEIKMDSPLFPSRGTWTERKACFFRLKSKKLSGSRIWKLFIVTEGGSKQEVATFTTKEAALNMLRKLGKVKE